MTDTLSTAEKTTRTSAAAPVTHADPENAAPRPPIQFLGIPLPTPISQGIRYVADKGNSISKKTIGIMPSFIVNNSSNVIATVQVGSEILMMRASGTKTLADAKRALLQDTKFTGGIESIKTFFDLPKATELEKKLHGDRLINRWQARSVLSGLTTMAFMTMLPDDKDSQEEIDSAVKLQHENKLLYAASCIGKAVNPFQWHHNKRYLAGLGLTLAGVCSLFSGFRNVGRLTKGGPEIYVSNWAHSAGGAITTIAGSQLLFAVDNRQGWARWGSTMWGRMAFLPKSILNRYKKNDPHANWYSAGQFGLQSSNVLSFLIGGAEKRTDGTVVDYDAMLRQAKEKASAHPKEKKSYSNGQEVLEQSLPQTRIQTDGAAQVEHTPPQQNAALAKA